MSSIFGNLTIFFPKATEISLIPAGSPINVGYSPTLVPQTVKNLPTVHETRVWPLGGEDFLEKGMAIHSSILVWRIPWTEEPDVAVHGVAKSWMWLSN